MVVPEYYFPATLSLERIAQYSEVIVGLVLVHRPTRACAPSSALTQRTPRFLHMFRGTWICAHAFETTGLGAPPALPEVKVKVKLSLWF